MRPTLGSISNVGWGAGANIWITDPKHFDRLAAVGATGEIVVEGPLVGQGYLGDPSKTAAVFIDSPNWLLRGDTTHSGRQGQVYKTGDLGRYNDNGSL